MRRHLIPDLCVAAVLAFAGPAAFVYQCDSMMVDSYRPVSAVALETDGAGIESPYTYRVGDRLCRGSTPAAIEPGTPLTVYYDPKDPCSSVSTNPVETRFGHQAMLLVFAAYLAALLWVVRISSQPSREMTWQVR